ncbi:MAG: ATP-binding cassette domain-containing protein [Armatimonadetes bacterium]|nr:ATP-binding cassette domain-containing protein [Armatimonadota bacterium]
MTPGEPLLTFDRVALESERRTVSFQILPGDAYALMGSAASGKTKLLDIALKQSKPASGEVHYHADTITPADGAFGRRATPASLAKSFLKKGEHERITTTLTALGLWEVRDQTANSLTTGQIIACSLLGCFLVDDPLVIIDGHLDMLDPWLLEEVSELIEAERQAGRAFLISTNRPDIAERLGSIIVLRGSQALFAGTCRELIESVQASEITVELDDETTVATMVEPFTVSVKTSPGRLDITAHDGQALAAKLLTHGYGRVKSVVLREPTLEQALLTLR